MTHLSPAAVMAWKIAMLEALKSGSEYLEKEHLLIGLYSLEKVLTLKDLHRDPRASKQVLEEKDALDFPLCNAGLDATIFRRMIRTTLSPGKVTGKEKILHRSLDCRNCFERAATLANGKEVNCVHLFNAILENPGLKILKVVEQASPHGTGAAAPSLSIQMTRALHQFRMTQDNKEHILHDIDKFQHTLTTLPRDSERYANLKRELSKKTIQLALACLDLHELSQLVHSLKYLSSESVQFRPELMGFIPQLEYMQREGIRIGISSSDLIRCVLKKLESEIGYN